MPRDPTHALQARISRLRSSLPALQLELVNGGYSLHAASYQLDSDRFETFRKEGSALLTQGHLDEAADLLRNGLGLWRGPAFSGVVDVQSVTAESARLETLRTSTLADRIDIDLVLGNVADVIPELSALVEESPFSERHWGQLMTALYQSGRTQEALDVYARVRTLFAELLGSEPGGNLGDLHTLILRGQPSDSLLNLPTQSSSISTAPSIQSGHTSSIDIRINTNDADKLASLLHDHRALILTGAAGIGKTHVLRAVQTKFESQYCLAPFLSANALSRAIPLGVFAGVPGIPTNGQLSAASLIDTFVRRRSTTMLLVDDVKMLDESSLFVVTQLISSSRIPTIVVAETITDAPPEIRALYDSGDLVEVSVTELNAEETYALGFSELFSGDPRKAVTLATSAVEHLRWRDVSGLLPAASALAAAATYATAIADSSAVESSELDAAAVESGGVDSVAEKLFAEIPKSALGDPKVVMLQTWADALRSHQTGRLHEASRKLLDTASWLLSAQHTYFAGILAHCAIRIGLDMEEGSILLSDAHGIAGGGLLHLMVRHSQASLEHNGSGTA